MILDMKLMHSAVLLALLTTPVPRVASAQPPDSELAFRSLKTLIGTWDAREKDNPTFAEEVTYSMTGRGTVIIEDMEAPKSVMGHMLTAYHLDVGTLVMTHFCGAGNQPRMRIKAVEDGGRRLAFEMYDITNLRDAKSYHSVAVDVLFLSDDRVDLVYRGKAGETKTTQVFQLTRKKG
jgi:hypothetical protein